MIIEELLTKIGFDVDEKPLGRVEELLEGVHKKLEIVAGIEIVKGIYELAERFSGLGEQIETAAVSAGITTDAFQKLAYAASQNAVSQDELSGGLGRLNRMLYQAKQGSQAAVDAFSSVGISPEQIAGFRTSSDALHAVSDAFAGMDDPIKKQALAMQLFGRGSANMVKLLSVGGKGLDQFGDEAEQLGAVLSGQGVEALAKFEDTMSGLGQVIKVFLATIAAGFAPVIGIMVKEMEKFWIANQAVIKQDIQEWSVKAAYAFGFIFEAVRIVIGVFLTFANAHPVLIKRAGELWLALLAVSLVVGAIGSAIGLVAGPLAKLAGLFSTVGEAGGKGFGVAVQAVGLLKNALGSLLLRLAVLVESVFPALSEAAFAAGAALQTMTAGAFALWLAGIVAAVGALYLAFDALWDMWNGKSFWDTKFGKGLLTLEDWGKRAGGWLKKTLGFGDDNTAPTFDMQAASAADSQSPMARIAAAGSTFDMMGAAQTAANGMSSLAGMAQPARPATLDFSGSAPAVPITYNMAQTNNITVPPGMDPKDVGPFIQRGVQDATERQLREAHRGLQTAATH